MASILVIGTAGTVEAGTALLEAVALGAELAQTASLPLVGGIVGSDTAGAADRLSASGVGRVLVATDPRLASYGGDVTVAAAEALVRSSDASTIIIPADADSVEWAPRLAARLSATIATNCDGARVDAGSLIAGRVVAGGVLRAEYRLETPISVLLLSPGLQLSAPEAVPACPVEPVEFTALQRAELLEFIPDETGEGPSLKNARIVVSGGMGVGGPEKWPIVEDAAVALGGAVGATRAAVEAGWVPAAKQVGFSGLKVGPDLYIAVGISGALHHLAGIGRAKKVVAINTDPDASIFQSSHIGVIGDAGEVLPAFTARVRELQGQ